MTPLLLLLGVLAFIPVVSSFTSNLPQTPLALRPTSALHVVVNNNEIAEAFQRVADSMDEGSEEILELLTALKESTTKLANRPRSTPYPHLEEPLPPAVGTLALASPTPTTPPAPPTTPTKKLSESIMMQRVVTTPPAPPEEAKKNALIPPPPKSLPAPPEETKKSALVPPPPKSRGLIIASPPTKKKNGLQHYVGSTTTAITAAQHRSSSSSMTVQAAPVPVHNNNNGSSLAFSDKPWELQKIAAMTPVPIEVENGKLSQTYIDGLKGYLNFVNLNRGGSRLFSKMVVPMTFDDGSHNKKLASNRLLNR